MKIRPRHDDLGSHSRGLAGELLFTIVESKHTLLLSNEMLHELANPELFIDYQLALEENSQVLDCREFPPR